MFSYLHSMSCGWTKNYSKNNTVFRTLSRYAIERRVGFLNECVLCVNGLSCAAL